jgi:hypothetical protein
MSEHGERVSAGGATAREPAGDGSGAQPQEDAA